VDNIRSYVSCSWELFSMSKSCKVCLFLLMSFAAGLISVYDNVLNVIFMETLPVDEQNPMASMIIDYVGVVGLVHIKSVTTILAVLFMCILSFTKYRIAIIPVLIFQCLLFYYLTFYTPTGNFLGNGYESIFGPLELFWRFYTENEIPSVDFMSRPVDLGNVERLKLYFLEIV